MLKWTNEWNHSNIKISLSSRRTLVNRAQYMWQKIKLLLYSHHNVTATEKYKIYRTIDVKDKESPFSFKCNSHNLLCYCMHCHCVSPYCRILSRSRCLYNCLVLSECRSTFEKKKEKKGNAYLRLPLLSCFVFVVNVNLYIFCHHLYCALGSSCVSLGDTIFKYILISTCM